MLEDHCKEAIESILGPRPEDLKDLPQHRTFTPAKTSTIRPVKQNKMKFTLFTAIFFSMGWMSIEVSDHEHSNGRLVSCCLTVSNIRIPVTNIVLLFHTIKNKSICSDSHSSWAKYAMAIVDSRNQLKKESSKEPFVYDTITANVIPTTPTIQRITTEGDGHPVSCCYTMISTIPVRRIPLHIMRALKSCNKKGLHKVQMGMHKLNTVKSKFYFST